MKIEITATQANIILSALKARQITVCNSNASTTRKIQLKNEINALRNMIAINMMKNGFITQNDFNIGNY